MENTIGLVGKVVKYSKTPQELFTAFVLEKINMKEKPTDLFTITGYIVEDDVTGELHSIAHWRIKKIIHNKFSPERPLEGGYIRQQ